MISYVPIVANHEASRIRGPRFELTSGEKVGKAILARNHRNQLRIAELSRWFRSSIISACIVTGSKSRIPESAGQFAKIRFKSLLYWTCKCGRRSCAEQLQLPTEWGKRPLSIGMRGSRPRLPYGKVEISGDRLDTCECLSEMGFWTHAPGPFVLYFVRIFHPDCKGELGKTTVNDLL
jgi:hypothetical protein